MLIKTAINGERCFSNNSWVLKWERLSARSAAAAAKSPRLCPTLCDPRDGSPPQSPIHGILQARVLEWVAIAFSARSSDLVKIKVKTYLQKNYNITFKYL